MQIFINNFSLSSNRGKGSRIPMHSQEPIEKELERLKKDWNKHQNFPELSKEEIYKFLHKKSSSIVKWIFIISLLEFGFWSLIALATKNNETQQRFDSYNVDHIMIPLMVIGYVILIYFFVIFYKNYKEISNTDSTKSLMQKIINTRKTVKHYVIFNLVFLFISFTTILLLERSVAKFSFASDIASGFGVPGSPDTGPSRIIMLLVPSG